MKSIKELYKIGRGPSSSHTMGPEKAALYFKNKYKESDSFKAILYGSLSMTGKGHLTDWILKKILGKDTEITFDNNTSVSHPNTFVLEAYKDNKLIGKDEFVSIGGGDIIINGLSDIKDDIYPFKTFNDIKEYSIKNNISLENIVYKFEGNEIKEFLNQVYDIMIESINNGLNNDSIIPGSLKLKRKAKLIFNSSESNNDDKKRIVAYSYAVSEENASGGIVVTAPTCGSSGVMPSCLYYYQNKYNIPKNKIIDSLAVAGLFGNVVKENASISGALLGCQAEVGTACSMAAAALAYLNNEDLFMIESAAEIAMEHHLGLTCDPVNGLVQIPCIERNAVASLRAIDAQYLSSLPIYPERISFDDVVLSMYETGLDLHPRYKETSKGGLANRIK